MELQINNQQVHFESNTLTIQEMLDIHQPNRQIGIALAVNNTVIAKSAWATYALTSTDAILIITATQGG